MDMMGRRISRRLFSSWKSRGSSSIIFGLTTDERWGGGGASCQDSRGTS
jgi:hypothetical protein